MKVKKLQEENKKFIKEVINEQIIDSVIKKLTALPQPFKKEEYKQINSKQAQYTNQIIAIQKT